MSALGKVEDALAGLQFHLSKAARGVNELEVVYPHVRETLTEAERALKKLDLFDSLVSAIDRSESLALEGRFTEADDLILEISRTLMRRSGSEARMRQLYKS